MRKIAGALLLLILCLPLNAFADMDVRLNLDKLVLGEWLQVNVADEQEGTYIYSLHQGEKCLFEGMPTTAVEGWYQPQQAGEYVLRVKATGADGTESTVEKAFRVFDVPVCTVTVPAETATAGQPVEVQCEVTGGTGDFVYDVALLTENGCDVRVVADAPVMSLTPQAAGEYRLLLTVTDQGGHVCTAETTLTVSEGPGITVTGDTGAFHAGGGVGQMVVQAPGLWTAETESDFISLHQTCGENGDALVLSVHENNSGMPRTGSITLRSGVHSLTVDVHQTDTFPMEQEAYMEPVTDVVFVDGDTLCGWNSASGRREFEIISSSAWQAFCDADFVALNTTEHTLTLVLEDNETDAVREAAVTVSCGRAQAVISVSQMPVRQGADVNSVRLMKTEGVGYQDEITALITTTDDAQTLKITSDMWQQPICLDAAAAAAYQGELLWQVQLPLRGLGEKQVLFTAEGTTGANRKQTALLQVLGEETDFEGRDVQVRRTENGLEIDVWVTRSAERITLDDTMFSTVKKYTADNAFIDRAPGGDPNSRYVKWTLTAPADKQAAYLTLGENSVGLYMPEEQEQAGFCLYSQQDTSWDTVKYRQSDLETSGCAIFALSHALQLLGFEGEEILPANLAKEYAFCLVEGGTLNSTLVGNAGKNLGFKTRFDLYESLPEIVDKTRQGAMWSFMVAKGHIAAVVGMSEDGKMFRVIDSAPSATFERTEKGTMYLLKDDGTYEPIMDLSDVPGSRYYLESSGYNGMEYWMTAEYIAKQGVRLIMPLADE